MAINWTAIEDAIYDWFSSATELETVVWANQTTPQRSLPLGVLKIGAITQRGSVDEVRDTTDLDADPGEEITTEVVARRELTVNCQILSENNTGDSNAKGYLSRASAALLLPANKARFVAAGLGLIGPGAISDLTAVMGTSFQSRAAMDVKFNVTEVASVVSGYIDDVEFEVEYE